jgi:hypothetical protein
VARRARWWLRIAAALATRLVVGDVVGVVARTRELRPDLRGLNPLDGYVVMLTDSRQDAVARMVEMAVAAGADLIDTVRLVDLLGLGVIGSRAGRLDDTKRAWHTWSELHQSYDGPWEELVHHSGRVLYALTYFPTGALCAAPTTSRARSSSASFSPSITRVASLASGVPTVIFGGVGFNPQADELRRGVDHLLDAVDVRREAGDDDAALAAREHLL